MHARVGTFEGPSEKVDELSRIATERVVPSLKQMDGYRGVLALADRRSGKVLAVTLWESEEAMLQSEGAADRLRSDSARAAGETVAGVERYKVVLSQP